MLKRLQIVLFTFLLPHYCYIQSNISWYWKYANDSTEFIFLEVIKHLVSYITYFMAIEHQILLIFRFLEKLLLKNVHLKHAYELKNKLLGRYLRIKWGAIKIVFYTKNCVKYLCIIQQKKLHKNKLYYLLKWTALRYFKKFITKLHIEIASK